MRRREREGGGGGVPLRLRRGHVEGGRGLGRATAREWRRPDPLPLREMDTQRDQDQEDAGKRCITQGERQYTSKTEGPADDEPQGVNRELGTGQGHKKRGKRTRDKAVDASTRHGEQS